MAFLDHLVQVLALEARGQVGAHQLRGLAPQDLVRDVAEEPGQGGVEGEEVPLQILGVDEIAHVVEKSSR